MKLLRRALEGDPDKAIKIEGPISSVFTEALAAALDKKNTDIEIQQAPAMETQAIDSTLAQGMSVSNDKKAFTTFYTINKSSATQADVVNITNRLNNVDKNHETDFYIVLDATKMYEDLDRDNQHESEKMVDLNVVAIESIAAAFGVTVLHSLDDVVKHIG